MPGQHAIHYSRAGSRIFRGGGGGGVDPFWGGFGLQRGHFLVKMYAKTKKLGPVGVCVLAHPLDLPMHYSNLSCETIGF